MKTDSLLRAFLMCRGCPKTRPLDFRHGNSRQDRLAVFEGFIGCTGPKNTVQLVAHKRSSFLFTCHLVVGFFAVSCRTFCFLCLSVSLDSFLVFFCFVNFLVLIASCFLQPFRVTFFALACRLLACGSLCLCSFRLCSG